MPHAIELVFVNGLFWPQLSRLNKLRAVAGSSR